MKDRIKWPDADIALIFIRPVFGLSEEIQLRMTRKAVEKLGIKSELYQVPQGKTDTGDERGELLKGCRGNEVVVVARLNVLGRTRKEVSRTVSRDFVWFVGELKSQCQYILVLDDNLASTPVNTPITSDDDEWLAVVERATDVLSQSRKMQPGQKEKMQAARWKGDFRGVYDEWTKNPERAEEREAMARIWRDPVYPNAKAAYAALPENVRKYIKTTHMAGKIFGKRKPGKNFGRPKNK